MIDRKTYEEKQKLAILLIEKAAILITEAEKENIEVVDFGLNNLEIEGAQILTMFSTERLSGKIIAMLPLQTEPEHWHPPVGNDSGKEETLRVVYGTLYLCIPGSDNIKESIIPEGKRKYYTARHEIVLKPGDQITLQPGTKHWFQSGETGAVVYTFSTCVRDILDKFSDTNVIRQVQVID